MNPGHSGRTSCCTVHGFAVNQGEVQRYISGTNTVDGFKIKLVLLTRKKYKEINYDMLFKIKYNVC